MWAMLACITDRQYNRNGTYPLDARHPHLLLSILAALKPCTTNGLQLQLLCFGNGSLKVQCTNALEVALVLETCHQLHCLCGALHSESDQQVVLVICSVSRGRSLLLLLGRRATHATEQVVRR